MNIIFADQSKHNDDNIKNFFIEENFYDDMKNTNSVISKLIPIGVGKYSKVYSFKNKYAIKILNTINNDYITEVIILNTIKHKNIISGMGMFKYENSLCLIMEKADISLSNYKFKNDNEKNIVSNQLISGLKHLHLNKYLHLDISMDNILISNSSGNINAYISDFSLSCKSEKLEIVTNSPKISIFYRPYENLLGSNIYSNKSDMWSLGILLYEIKTGNRFIDYMTELDTDDKCDTIFSTILHIEKLISWSKFDDINLLNLNKDKRSFPVCLNDVDIEVNREINIKKLKDNMLQITDKNLYCTYNKIINDIQNIQ